MKVEEQEIGRAFGTNRWAQVIRTPTPGDDGGILGIQAEVRDTTPRKLQQSVTRVLAESATLRDATAAILRAICQGMGWDFGAIWITDPDAQVLRCVETWHAPAVHSEKLEDSSRRNPLRRGEGLSGRVWADGRPVWITDLPTGLPRVFTKPTLPFNPIATGAGLRSAIGFPLLLRGEVLGVLEFLIRQAFRRRDPDGDRLSMMAAISSQIGQFIGRERAEQERDRSLALIQSIIDDSPASISIKDTKGRYLFINRGGAKLFGCNPQEAKGKTDHDLFPSRLADLYREHDKKILRDGKPAKFEEVTPRPDGEHIYRSRKYPLRDAAGVPYGVGSISTDITEQRLAEAAKQHDISHLIEGVPAVLKQVSALSQELTPEQSARLAVAMERVNLLVSEVQAVTQTKLNFIRRSRNGGGSAPALRRCNAEVRRWLQVVPTLMRDDVIEVRSRYRLAEDEPFLADLAGVKSALRNLWTNAKNAFKDVDRHSYRVIFSVNVERPEGVEARAADAAYIVLRAADNGTGIPSGRRDRIFQGRTDDGSGHGLGSQIIRWVMEQHRGLIRCATGEGLGTLVELWFPRLVLPGPDRTLEDQWKMYRTLREEVGPVRWVSERALLTILADECDPS